MRFTIVACAVLFSLAAVNSGNGADKRPPNIVFILADDLGYSDIGCYGGEIETPHLNALAQNGLRFSQFYNTARCWPTRAAVLTGYYPQQVRRDSVEGVKGGAQGIRPAWAKLLPEMLRPLGYRNYHSGKWHVDGEPLKQGFDHSYQIEGGQNNYFQANGITDDGRPVPQTADYYVTTAIGEHAARCLKEHAEKFADQPFFHYICFTAPHFPLHAPAEDIARYREKYRRGWDTVQAERYERLKQSGLIHHALPAMEREIGPPYHNPEALVKLGPGELNRPLPWAELSEEQRDFQATKMAIHAAMIDRMDQAIGLVVKQLQAMHAFEDTLILFASDNGASAEIMVRGGGHDPQAPLGSAATYPCLGPGWSSVANTPFRRHKTWVHEGGISTPLIAHWPRGIAARGELRHQPGHMIDIVPTVLELCELKPPVRLNDELVPPLPGKSLVPALRKTTEVFWNEIWWSHEGNRAIRQGDWKLVSAKKDGWELYDLKHDRGESNNMAEQQADLVQRMAARWQQLSDQFGDLARQDIPVPLRETKKKK